MIDQNRLLFLKRMLKNPRRVGAVLPSGKALANAIVAQIDPRLSGPVVELGPGTGAFTKAILGSGRAGEGLWAVELDPTFVENLRQRFPGATFVEGSAEDVLDLLTQVEGQAKAVVSGLPLLLMKDDVRARILENSFALLQPRGRYIQFTYGLLCPVPLKIRRRLGIRARRADVVFDNIPPVTVWVFEHA